MCFTDNKKSLSNFTEIFLAWFIFRKFGIFILVLFKIEIVINHSGKYYRHIQIFVNTTLMALHEKMLIFQYKKKLFYGC